MVKYLFTFLSFLAVSLSTVYPQVAPAHIVIVVLENKGYSQVAGSQVTPFINSLIADTNCAVLTNSYGLTHPSQPNYLHLFSGSNQGVIDNSLPAGLPFTTPNLGAALLQKGFGFAGFSEDLPSTGYNGEINGAYARKHNPWVNWQQSPINGIPLSQNKPFTDFPSNFFNLPTVSFVIPNQTNDMHDGAIETALPLCDAWLKSNLKNYVEWCKSNNSVFILSFDEDDGSYNNHVLTLITGEHIIGGTYNQPVTHYNVLRTIEELYHLPYAGISADSAAIKGIWNTDAVCKGAGTQLQSNITGMAFQWQVNRGSGFNDITDNINYNGSSTSTLQLNNVPSSWYGYQYRCLVDGAYSSTKTIRIIDYWTGAISDAWENPLNWSCGSVPDQNTDVIIHTNSTVNLSSPVSVRSFIVSAGARFTQKSSGTLIITH